MFEGEKHSAVPDVDKVRMGQEELDVGAVEDQINQQILAEHEEKQHSG